MIKKSYNEENKPKRGLENPLIKKLENFFLQLEKGFALVKRKYEISVKDHNHYIDLIFYNYHLKCFLIVDIKTNELTPQDIRQMDFYIKYFENQVSVSNNNPSIGLILCTVKEEKPVQYIFSENTNDDFKSQYKVYLPSEELLIKKIMQPTDDIVVKEKNFNDLVSILVELQQTMEGYLPGIASNVDELIKNESKSIKEIETVLDTLLNLAFTIDVKEIFSRLIAYYYTVNAAYARSYEEMYEDIITDNGML